jgi:hypothetical protein
LSFGILKVIASIPTSYLFLHLIRTPTCIGTKYFMDVLGTIVSGAINGSV